MTGIGDRQPQDRVEGLLRQWGAEEAARQAADDGLPLSVAASVPGRQSPARPSLLMRWGPLAAAAALAIVAGGLFVAAYGVRTYKKSVQSPAAVETTVNRLMVRDLASRLADTEAALQQSQEKLAAATRSLDEARRVGGAPGSDTDGDRLREELSKLRDRYEKQLADKDRELRTAREQALQLGEVREELANVRRELGAETSRLQSLNEKTVAANGRLEKELETVKAQQTAVFENLRQGPLAASAARNWYYAAPVDGAWRGEGAGDVGKLLQLGTALRGKASGDAGRQLFDKIEVMLTRFNLLDPSDAAATESFAALVRRSGLAEEIGKALDAGDQPADVQAWLLEVQLVLMGAKHAG